MPVERARLPLTDHYLVGEDPAEVEARAKVLHRRGDQERRAGGQLHREKQPTSARAGSRHFWLLSAMCAHTKAPYRTDLHRKTLRALNHPRRAWTVRRFWPSRPRRAEQRRGRGRRGSGSSTSRSPPSTALPPGSTSCRRRAAPGRNRSCTVASELRRRTSSRTWCEADEWRCEARMRPSP